MKNLFYPDDYKSHFAEYDAAYLRERGIRFLTCDIDNTLVTYDDAEPTEAVSLWLSSLADAGITVAFISNNDEARVSRFNRGLYYHAKADAHKPLTRTMRMLLIELGAKKEECAHLGDQVFTDVLMARLCGVSPLLVPPIKDRLTPFFRIKRACEKPIVSAYVKKYNKERFF